MKKKGTAAIGLAGAVVMGALLSGCQGTLPPDGYNCKNGSSWNTTGSYSTASSGSGTYNSTGNYKTSLDTGSDGLENWNSSTSGTSDSWNNQSAQPSTSINWTTNPNAGGSGAAGDTGSNTNTGRTDGRYSGSADSYMLTESSSRYYSAEELADLTVWELQVAWSEIYARHGVVFGAGAIQDHFNTRNWYQGTVLIEAFDSSVFNEYETANVTTIQGVEQAKLQ